MTDPQQPQRPGDFACPYSADSEFDQALRQVQGLLQEGKLEPALDLLLELEKKYIQAVRLFDLLADVLLRSGQIKPGIRYKTLHEILRGTYKIAKEEMRVDGTIDSGLRFRPGASPTGEGAIEFVPFLPEKLLSQVFGRAFILSQRRWALSLCGKAIFGELSRSLTSW